MTNIEFLEGDTFDLLRSWERERRRFDLVVLDPPAFAKTKSAVPQALRGYNEINLRGFRRSESGRDSSHRLLLLPRRSSRFQEMLARAAEDSGRRVTLRQLLAQAPDHPEILSIPGDGVSERRGADCWIALSHGPWAISLDSGWLGLRLTA